MYTVRRSQNLGAVINQATGISVSSAVIQMYDVLGMSVQFDYGIVSGTLTLMGSNDNVTFYAIADVSFNAPAGVAGGQIVELGNLRSQYYRFDWAKSGGTGAVKVTVHAKERS